MLGEEVYYVSSYHVDLVADFIVGVLCYESLTYEPTVDDMIERERDLKSHPALLNGVGFSA